jgi:hypothetical protein
MCFLMVLAMVLSFMGGSGSRAWPLSGVELEVSGFRVENTYEINLRALTAMLPKGPVPPSGPSPGIN